MSEEEKDRCGKFVEYVLKRSAGDKGFAARMRAADNPALEHHAWGAFARFNLDLENRSAYLPYAVAGASLCREGRAEDGSNGFGRALAIALGADSSDDADNARLGRVLTCGSVLEACEMIKPLLRLIESRGADLCRRELISDLLRFGGFVKRKWARDFYAGGVGNDVS